MSFFRRLKSAIMSVGPSGSDKADIASIEDLLIESDFGPVLAFEISNSLSKSKDVLHDLSNILEDELRPFISNINVSDCPYVILVLGVNGSGKTTTIAKLAHFFQNKGYSVDIAACDTFRAAATEQLSVWADRLGCGIFKSDSPRDPASVAFEAVSESKSDVIIIDTAGRLSNNQNLMNELQKIRTVISKVNSRFPDATLITIDSTTGQNSLDQVRGFDKVCPISGMILTKMDGSAKGGAIFRIVREFKIPIVGVGIGETFNDFQPFLMQKFLKDLKK